MVEASKLEFATSRVNPNKSNDYDENKIKNFTVPKAVR